MRKTPDLPPFRWAVQAALIIVTIGLALALNDGSIISVSGTFPNPAVHVFDPLTLEALGPGPADPTSGTSPTR